LHDGQGEEVDWRGGELQPYGEESDKVKVLEEHKALADDACEKTGGFIVVTELEVAEAAALQDF
jgi:hypothetical protein